VPLRCCLPLRHPRRRTVLLGAGRCLFFCCLNCCRAAAAAAVVAEELSSSGTLFDFFARLSADAPPAAARCRVCVPAGAQLPGLTDRWQGRHVQEPCRRGVRWHDGHLDRGHLYRLYVVCVRCGPQAAHAHRPVVEGHRQVPRGAEPGPDHQVSPPRTLHCATQSKTLATAHASRLQMLIAPCHSTLSAWQHVSGGAEDLSAESSELLRHATLGTYETPSVFTLFSEPAVAACAVNKHTFLIQKE
jgi:hypothetical protein